MFTDEEFSDLLACLDVALEDEHSPLTSFGVQKITALRAKVQSLRDAAPNKACSQRNAIVAAVFIAFVSFSCGFVMMNAIGVCP